MDVAPATTRPLIRADTQSRERPAWRPFSLAAVFGAHVVLSQPLQTGAAAWSSGSCRPDSARTAPLAFIQKCVEVRTSLKPPGATGMDLGEVRLDSHTAQQARVRRRRDLELE